MKQKTTFSPPAVGISSLLAIFAVLCLTIFSLLSISTVSADIQLAEKSRTAVRNYYQADRHAEAVLAKLRAGEIPQGVTVSGSEYAYLCKVSDTQALSVAVAIDGTSYTILRWQVISTVDWQASVKLPVWAG